LHLLQSSERSPRRWQRSVDQFIGDNTDLGAHFDGFNIHVGHASKVPVVAGLLAASNGTVKQPPSGSQPQERQRKRRLRQPSRLSVDTQSPQGLGPADAVEFRIRVAGKIVEKGVEGFGRTVLFGIRHDHGGARG
jgi:hypothetical protein